MGGARHGVPPDRCQLIISGAPFMLQTPATFAAGRVGRCRRETRFMARTATCSDLVALRERRRTADCYGQNPSTHNCDSRTFPMTHTSYQHLKVPPTMCVGSECLHTMSTSFQMRCLRPWIQRFGDGGISDSCRTSDPESNSFVAFSN